MRNAQVYCEGIVLASTAFIGEQMINMMDGSEKCPVGEKQNAG